MNINATLIGQAIWFAIFIWITMKYVWPPLSKAMADRQAQIAEGLAAANRGQKDLDEAKAIEAKRRAEEALKDRTSDIGLATAEAELAQAVAQLQAIKRLRQRH